MSYGFATLIVSEKAVKKRVQILKKLILVAEVPFILVRDVLILGIVAPS